MMACGFVTGAELPEPELTSFPPASDAARRAVKAAAAAPSRDAAAAQMLAEEISPQRVAEALVNEEESADVSVTSAAARAGPWAERYTFPEQDERTIQILVRSSLAQPQYSRQTFRSASMDFVSKCQMSRAASVLGPGTPPRCRAKRCPNDDR